MRTGGGPRSYTTNSRLVGMAGPLPGAFECGRRGQMVCRITAVNNDPAVLGQVHQALMAHGYMATRLKGGLGIHELLRADRPAVVVLDIADAEPASGWHVLRAIRQDAALRDLPVLLVVSPGADLDQRQPLDAPTTVLLKPYTLPALLACIAPLCSHRGNA